MEDWLLIQRRGLVWPEKRVLVCGPTSFDDWDSLKAVLDKCRPTILVHGHAAGVDHLASLYAQMFRVDEMRFPAKWRAQGIDAAPIRNELMMVHGRPDLVLVFPGGVNVEDITRRARKASVTIIEVKGTDWIELPQAESSAEQRARA